MITLNASGSSVTFTFDGNSTYLNDGTITVPKNSLALIADESDMVTFRKSASNDIFVSANIAEFGMTKDELIAWFKANAVGDNITSDEVQTMIDESISGKADSSDVYTTGQTSGATELATALSAKLDATAYTVDSSISSASTNPVENQTLYDELRIPSEGEVETTLIWSESGLKTTTNYPSGCTEIKFHGENLSAGSLISFGFNDNNGEIGYITIGSDGYELEIVYSTMGDNLTYTVSGDVMTISYPTLTNVISLSSGNDLTNTPITVDTIGTIYIPLIDQVSANTTAISGKVDTTAMTQAITEATSGKVDSSAVYLKTETSGATELATAFASKQTTLTAGTGIDITDNVISATGGGGGGKAIEPGRGISVTTGETADTVSFNLPISAGTGTNAVVIGQYNSATGHTSYAEGSNTLSYNRNSHAEGCYTKALGMESHAEGFYTTAATEASHAEGCYTKANGDYSHVEGYFTIANGSSSHAEGYSTIANGSSSHAEGYSTIANNSAEHASGQYNNSVSASTTFGDSGNTLFSVGNGTSKSARHNAFEIRQNGDIYLSSGGTDIKLQDYLGGGSSYTAGAGIDITNDVISVTGMVATSAVTSAITSGDTNPVQGGAIYDKFDEVETVTAAALNNLNDKLGGLKLVKLTESEYAALVTKDPDVLYVVIPDPSNP